MPTHTASAAGANAAITSSSFDHELEERLLRYVRIDTQSDERSTTSPSTEKQYDLLGLLVDELTSIGARDVRLTDYGAVLATIPDHPHIATASSSTRRTVEPAGRQES